jgi:hypothetical protein
MNSEGRRYSKKSHLEPSYYDIEVITQSHDQKYFYLITRMIFTPKLKI